MYIAKLRKIGPSIMIALPASIVEALNLHENEEIAVEVDGDRIVLTRATPDFEDAWAAYQALEPQYRNANRELAR